MLSKKIILTFDYELFFFKSGTVENSILKPTDLFIKKAKELNIKAIFFVDVLFLFKLREYKELSTEYGLIVKQLELLVKEGHRLELHLHSHWLDAYYKDSNWVFPTYKNYSLHSLDSKKIESLFAEGTIFLNSVARRVDPNYSVNAFRAGGWCIQPFKPLKNSFISNGIKIESSSAFGVADCGDVHYYDFRNIPNKEYYSFKDSLSVEEDGEFIEFPITVYKKSYFSKLSKLFKKENFSYFGDGQGIPKHSTFIKKVLEKLKSTRVMFSIDTPDINLILNKLKSCNKSVITFISHPKFMNYNSLNLLEKMTNEGYIFTTYNDVLKGEHK